MIFLGQWVRLGECGNDCRETSGGEVIFVERILRDQFLGTEFPAVPVGSGSIGVRQPVRVVIGRLFEGA